MLSEFYASYLDWVQHNPGTNIVVCFGLAFSMGFAALSLFEKHRYKGSATVTDGDKVAVPDVDPGSIHQSGEQVAMAHGPSPFREFGFCYFDRIEGNGEFDPYSEFVFRKRRLIIESPVLHSGHFGKDRTQSFFKVKAKLLG